MATPLLKSSPGFGDTTPISASLLVRTMRPTLSESFGSPRGSRFILKSSGIVPITPPAKITRSVSMASRPLLPFVSTT